MGQKRPNPGKGRLAAGVAAFFGEGPGESGSAQPMNGHMMLGGGAGALPCEQSALQGRSARQLFALGASVPALGLKPLFSVWPGHTWRTLRSWPGGWDTLNSVTPDVLLRDCQHTETRAVRMCQLLKAHLVTSVSEPCSQVSRGCPRGSDG